MYWRTCGSFKSAKQLGSANCNTTSYKSANHKKEWVQIRKVSQS